MGSIKHEIVVAAVKLHDDRIQADVEAFRSSLDERWRHLIIGPVEGLVNGVVSYTFLPEGSKEGWDLADEGHELRTAFAALFAKHTDVVRVAFGGYDEGVESRLLGEHH